MSRVGGRAELGIISTAVWEGGMLTVGGSRVKEALGTLPRAGCEGGSAKMARVGGRVEVGAIRTISFVDLGIWADRLRRRDWGLYPGPGVRVIG
jgi:hypothetical protein